MTVDSAGLVPTYVPTLCSVTFFPPSLTFLSPFRSRPSLALALSPNFPLSGTSPSCRLAVELGSQQEGSSERTGQAGSSEGTVVSGLKLLRQRPPSRLAELIQQQPEQQTHHEDARFVDKSSEEGLGNVSRRWASTRFVRWRACIEVRGGHLEMKACSVSSVCGVGILAGDPGPKQSERPQEGANESQDDNTVKNVKTINFRNQGSQEGAIQLELRDENTHVETTPFRPRGASVNPGAEGGPQERVEGGPEGGVLEPAERALGGCGVGEGSVEAGGEEGPLFLELRHVNWGQARVTLRSCTVSHCGDVGILIGLHANALLLHVCCEHNGDAGILIRASGPLVREGGCRWGVNRDIPSNSGQASVSAMHCNIKGNMRQGVAVDGACARVTLRNSSLSQNSMQGLAVVEGGCGEVTGCKLSRNGWANVAAFDLGTRVTVCLSEILEGARR